MEKNVEKEMILNGGLWKTCLKLSLPAVIAMVLYGLNTVLDIVFIGIFVDENAIAGVSITSPLTQIPLGLGSLIGVGAGSYLSILIGQENKKEQGRLLGNANSLILILSILSMVLGFLFIDPLLEILGAKGQALTYGKDYFLVTVWGAIFWTGGLAYNMIVRAEGRMKTAAIMMGIGMVSNIIANYVFMGIFHFGVKGAAWGTNIAMGVYVVLFVSYCVRKKASFETNLFSIKWDKSIIKAILRLGTPSFLMTIMSVIQGIITLKALNVYGSISDVAFYGVVFRIFNFLMTPIYGLMRALQPAVGINFGARKYDRVIRFYKVFATVAFLMVLPFWLWSMINPSSVLALIMPGQTYSPVSLQYLRVMITIVPFLCIVLTAMTFYPAINKPLPAMIVGVGRQLFLYIPLMIILPRIFGIGGIYYGSLAIDGGLTLLMLVLLKNQFNILRSEKKVRSYKKMDQVEEY